LGAESPGFLKYANIEPLTGAIVSLKLATLHECQTVYGMEDAYDLLEIATVDAKNAEKMRKKQRKG
jgi:hypothetical protein